MTAAHSGAPPEGTPSTSRRAPTLPFLFGEQTCEATESPAALQKGADFIRAFTLGFEVQVTALDFMLLPGSGSARRHAAVASSPPYFCAVSQDAVALLRLDDLYLDSFQIRDGAPPGRICCACWPLPDAVS
jgi:hypothetical protein